MKNFSLVLMVSFLSLAKVLSAQGDLLVSPLRVVFEGKKVKEELSLANIGADSTTYTVSFIQYRMTEEGNFEIIEKPDSGQMFANPYLRIFPRIVKLGPKESQVVRLQYRKSKDMKNGEYRSHIYFRSEKDLQELGANKSTNDSSVMGVTITPIFGISIPVIIREGDISVKSDLSNLAIEKQPDTTTNLKLTINREGNVSTYGDIIVDYKGVNGKTNNIGLVRGVSVYTTVSKRHFVLKLNTIDGVDLTSGSIKVLYTSPKDTPYVVYAEKELVLTK